MRHRNVLSDYSFVQPPLPMEASEPRALFIHQAVVRKVRIRGRKVYSIANATLQLLNTHHASLPCISIEAHQAGYKTSDNMTLQASKASQTRSADIREVKKKCRSLGEGGGLERFLKILAEGMSLESTLRQVDLSPSRPQPPSSAECLCTLCLPSSNGQSGGEERKGGEGKERTEGGYRDKL